MLSEKPNIMWKGTYGITLFTWNSGSGKTKI